MNRSIVFVMILALGLFAVAGCNTAGRLLSLNATDTPAATEVPPTDTPAPPTATPAPTSTPTLAPPGNQPQDFLNALANTKGVASYRLDMTLNRTYVNKLGKTISDGGSIKFEDNGTDQHSTFTGTGLFSTATGTGSGTAFEFITLGNQFYSKGITFTKSMDPGVWYQYPVIASSAITRSVSTGKTILSNMKSDDFKAADLKATGIEILDLLPCVVWTIQNPQDIKSIGSFSNADVERELKVVDQKDIKVWTCADGRLHQIKATIQAHDPAKPSDKLTENFTLHMYDFNALIVIAPPPNPQPFPLR